uniref:NADH-ubiquinone oxidoreductase chain 6 n=1 Tax=Apoderus coryli TaxID=201766 RepID=J9PJU1_APOCO|nr:NADH dehydrogenase subunit 6 [Apoderus coryli]
MVLTLSLVIIFISMLFTVINHPLSFSLLTLILAIMIALTTSIIGTTSWFSYIIFLIMIGAMLILFLYMTSIAPNEKFKMSFKILIPPLMLSVTPFIWKFYDPASFSLNMSFLQYLSEYTPEVGVNELFNLPKNKILIGMILYLLLCLIAVVKITSSNQGPFRQKS